MALWLCRAGRLGEYETRFIEDNRIYCTWHNLDWDMSLPKNWEEFKEKVRASYPTKNENAIRNQTGQLRAFTHTMKARDLVAVPSKIKPCIYIGRIVGEYAFHPEQEERYQHARSVQWIKEVPRSAFDQDLLYSLGAFMTFCKISRNDAERRIRALVRTAPCTPLPEEPEEDVALDLEGNALQEIADQIIRRYKGHDLARKIIAPILHAKGFSTYISPAGPDKGVDILASQGSLGFDHPRICVQVKSGADPVERSIHDQLLGTMSNHKAEYGLLVSWGGFKNSIIRDTASHFFTVRLWTHREIVQEFLQHYADMPQDVREAVPLKQIWMLDKQTE